MARIAIIGPGAIGGTLAGWLANAGHHELVLCARTPFTRLSVRALERRFEPRMDADVRSARLAGWHDAVGRTLTGRC